VSAPELSVVCKSCGSEVSPYVTECPYCGTRLRRRAPKLERSDEGLKVREGRQERRMRRAAERRERRDTRAARLSLGMERPWVTIAVLVGPAVLMVVERAHTGLGVYDLGAVQGLVGDEWWRYLAAPFVYDDAGYLFVCALALAIFLPGVERRVGLVPTALLVIASGSLALLGAEGLEDAFGNGILVAAGGNGVALAALGAWWTMRDAERRGDPTDEYETIGVAIAAVVLLLLPLVEDYADPWVGLVGGLLGAACGLGAALGRRTA
jgi:membrane associated rhomboid family serine protease